MKDVRVPEQLMRAMAAEAEAARNARAKVINDADGASGVDVRVHEDHGRCVILFIVTLKRRI